MRWCYHRESEVIMDKKYIENQYHLAVLDFRTARSEEAQWEARKTMARLEQIASQVRFCTGCAEGETYVF